MVHTREIMSKEQSDERDMITPSESATRELKNAFKTFCKDADELSENHEGNLRSWWD